MQDMLETHPDVQLSPAALAALLEQDNPPVLLDVRDAEEFAIAKLPGGQLLTPKLLDEVHNHWPKDRDIVTYCHHGIRSMNMAVSLIGEGFKNVRSLAGGIDAWALEVDSTVVRY